MRGLSSDGDDGWFPEPVLGGMKVAQLNAKQGPVAQRITRWTTNPEIAGSNPARFVSNFFPAPIFCASPQNGKILTPPGGLEPPTFRLTAERASQLRHGGSWYTTVNPTGK